MGRLCLYYPLSLFIQAMPQGHLLLKPESGLRASVGVRKGKGSGEKGLQKGWASARATSLSVFCFLFLTEVNKKALSCNTWREASGPLPS